MAQPTSQQNTTPAGLLSRVLADGEIDTTGFADFLDAVLRREADRAEVVGVLTAYARQLPAPDQLVALVAALRTSARSGAGADLPPGTVNIVGTGGGPRTVNISTAAALVAVSTGVPVVKSGSRAHRSATGALDLLGRLGIDAASGPADLADRVRREGFAVAGTSAYPLALTALARTVAPLPLKTFATLLNTVGPFLADVPVSAQLTGFSRREHRQQLAALREGCGHPVWLCSNPAGVDELLSTDDNAVLHPDGWVEELPRGGIASGVGSTADLRPSQDGRSAIDAFTDVVSGRSPTAVTETVCLNAGALAVLSGRATSWRAGYSDARDVVADGSVLDTLSRLRRTALPAGAGRG